MSLERFLISLALALPFAAGLAACESSPRFDPTQPPIVGTIDEELRLIADGRDAQITLSPQTFPTIIDVPASALPPGTELLARRIHGVPFLAPASDDAGEVPGVPDLAAEPYLVVHFLPRSLAFAAPLVIEPSTRNLPSSAFLLWVYAAEDDARWTIVGRTAGDTPFEVTRPGVYGYFYVPPTRPGPPTDAGANDDAQRDQ